MILNRDKLIAEMVRRGLSTSDLHRQMVRSGADISRDTIRTWLSGEVKQPRPEHAALAAEILGLPQVELFTDATTPPMTGKS